MKNFIKGRWFPLVVAGVCALALVLVLSCLGFRITYAPNLENSWDAISGCAAWAAVMVAIASTAASFLAVWYAIQVPKEIAKQQDKIALFKQRYRLYDLLLSCQTFALGLKAAESEQDAGRIFLLTFFTDSTNHKELPYIGRTSICYLKVIQDLSLCEFLFPAEISLGVLGIVKRMSNLLSISAQVDEQSTFLKLRDEYISLYNEMKLLALKMKPYLILSD